MANGLLAYPDDHGVHPGTRHGVACLKSGGPARQFIPLVRADLVVADSSDDRRKNLHARRERLPHDGAYLFVSNHQSNYDIPILFTTLPFQLRIIAKGSLRRFPVLGWHLRYTGHLLVERDRLGSAISHK